MGTEPNGTNGAVAELPAMEDAETRDLIQKTANYDSTECYAGPTSFQTYKDTKLYEYIDYLAAHRVY